MEQKEFLLKQHIHEYHNVLKPKTVSHLLKYINYKDSQGCFDKATIIGDGKGTQKPNTEVRDTKNMALSNLGDSQTDIHWCNFLINIFTTAFNKYLQLHPLATINQVVDMQVLKYEQGGHYIPHVDDHPTIPRTLSFIYRLNNDYEGGDLVWYMNNKEFHRSKTAPNSLIMWPSNFLYPHTVEPVTKGLRWSIVAWAR
tara:strand:+ start:613 stop:1206 length:594 start_codon:yes stop_codon:yes gene_type:complete